MKLTDVAIRNAKSKSKPFKMYDSHGLFILIKPGGSKLWRWRYRFDGKEKLMALGSYPLIGLSHARDLHFAGRKVLALGIDPMAERRAESGTKQREDETRQRNIENSFESVARKWWERWSVGKSPLHAASVMRRLETDVFPAYGAKFIDNVTASDV